jgi:CRP-like cAMP-binding protein
MSVKPQLLRRCSALQDLSIDALNNLAVLSSAQWADRGEYLCRQGDTASTVYALLDGAIKQSRLMPSGRVMVTDFLGPGHIIGARALLGEDEYREDALILEDAFLAAFPKGPMMRLISVHCEIAIGLARYLGDRLSAQQKKVAALTTKRVHQRLAEGLLELSRTLSVRTNGRMVINARLTQADLAEWIGTTRETASTLLNELRRAGPIDIVGRRIHLLDTEALDYWASSEEPWLNSE